MMGIYFYLNSYKKYYDAICLVFVLLGTILRYLIADEIFIKYRI